MENWKIWKIFHVKNWFLTLWSNFRVDASNSWSIVQFNLRWGFSMQSHSISSLDFWKLNTKSICQEQNFVKSTDLTLIFNLQSKLFFFSHYYFKKWKGIISAQCTILGCGNHGILHKFHESNGFTKEISTKCLIWRNFFWVSWENVSFFHTVVHTAQCGKPRKSTLTEKNYAKSTRYLHSNLF